MLIMIGDDLDEDVFFIATYQMVELMTVMKILMTKLVLLIMKIKIMMMMMMMMMVRRPTSSGFVMLNT